MTLKTLTRTNFSYSKDVDTDNPVKTISAINLEHTRKKKQNKKTFNDSVLFLQSDTNT